MFKIVETETKFEELKKVARGTFKTVCTLNKTTKNEIVEALMNIDITERAEERIQVAKEKWMSRKQRGNRRDEEEAGDGGREERQQKIDVSMIPKSMIAVINVIGKKLCKLCQGKRMTMEHITGEHKMQLETMHVLQDLEKMRIAQKAENTTGMRQERKRMIQEKYDKFMHAIRSLM